MTAPTAATVLKAQERHSGKAWIDLLEIQLEVSASVNRWALLAAHPTNVTFDGRTYYARSCSIELPELSAEQLPQTSATIDDTDRVASGYLKAYAPLAGNRVVHRRVHEDLLASGDSGYVTQWEIISAGIEQGVADGAITSALVLQLGTPSLHRSRKPRFVRNVCSHRYKGALCGYTGTIAACDLSLDGPNGCTVHDNQARFGGAPSLPHPR